MFLVLAACSGNPNITVVGGKESNAPAGTPLKKAQPPVIASIPEVTEPVVEPEKPMELLEPTILVGKSSEEILEILGEPTLRRKDSPAEVWQYLTEECALHLFFYPAKTGEIMEMNHIAINGRSLTNQGKIDSKKCFNDHLRELGAHDILRAREAS
jgi:hypothetical protein